MLQQERENMPDLTTKTRDQEGSPCRTELRILGGDNIRRLAGLELVLISARGEEDLVWKYYLSAEQTTKLIEDQSPADNNIYDHKICRKNNK